MRSPSIPLTLVLALLLTACASRGVRDSKAGDLFLWSIAAEEGAEPVGWVLGSVHVARQGDGLDRAALDAYGRARTLAVELDLDTLDPAAINRIITTSGSYQAGASLSAALGAKDFERLGRLLEKVGIPVEAVDKWKPWLAAMVLGFTSMQQGGDGGAAEGGGEGAGQGGAAVGVDRFFLDRARGERPIVSLETIDEQIDALTSATEAVQLAELRHTIDALESGESPLDEVLDSYMEGDASALEAQVSAGGVEGERKAWLDRIIKDRNVHMAERAAALIRRGEKPFIVVGAGHLVGPGAVQTLLGGMGFHITPVRRTGEKVPLVLGDKSAGPAAATPPAQNLVTGYRVGWSCAETASGPLSATDPSASNVICKDGDIVYVLTTLGLPTGTGNLLGDAQFFGLQMEQLKSVATGPVDHAPAKVGTVDSTGRALASEFPALRFALDTAQSRLIGVMVKDGDRVYNLMAVAPPGAAGVERVPGVLSTLVLVLADE